MDISFVLFVEKPSISILFKLWQFWNILDVFVILSILMFSNCTPVKLRQFSNIEVASEAKSVSMFINDICLILLQSENISLKVDIFSKNLITTLTIVFDSIEINLSKGIFLSSI